MGNHLSCMYPISPSARFSAIKVMHAIDGRISEFDEPLKVAEVMLEHPNHFVIHSTSLHTGQRISPLPADEELQLSQVYILLPMHKLHTRLSAEEQAFFSAVLSKSANAKPSKHGQSKVTPLRLDPTAVEDEETDFDGTGNAYGAKAKSYSFQLSDIPELQIAGAQHMMSRSRSWIPKLETISESSLLKA